MPLGSFLKNWVHGENNEMPPQKSEEVMVAESLIMELDFQLKEAIDREEQQEKSRRLERTGVDYSWLVTEPRKPKNILSQAEKLELEELSLQVKPDECGTVIKKFREALLKDPSAQEIPRHYRCVINGVIETRPTESEPPATIPEWLTKSFSKLRPASGKVVPMAVDMEEGRVSSLPSMKDSSTFYIQHI